MILATKPLFLCALIVGCCQLATPLGAQQAMPVQGNQGFGNQGFFGPALGGGPGAAGGAANADFDSLIDLIVSTVEYDSWMENGAGEGEIQPFPNGVYADPEGTLRFDKSLTTEVSLRRAPRRNSEGQKQDVRQRSTRRFVSLARLERAIADHQAAHQPLPPEMLTLAGLERIEFVLINPATNDLILAGPAGNWRLGPTGALVSAETGKAVMRLDDLLTLWRRPTRAPFGCSITPRQQALADTQAYLNRSAAKPLEPNQRDDWLGGLRRTLGKQDVEFFNLAADSHLAVVMLVADYHMKLVGMGLAGSVDGVESYLDTVELQPNGAAPPMAVLRWWFAMVERTVQTNEQRDAFVIPAGGVQVLSENELLAARGQRVHTHQSDALNRRFAESFTEEFANFAAKYPVYSELENVFNLALVLTLIDRENLVERSGWQPALFEDAASLRLPQWGVPREVETVVNHRVINRRHIVAGISGGVWIDAAAKTRVAVSTELDSVTTDPPNNGRQWWWD